MRGYLQVLILGGNPSQRRNNEGPLYGVSGGALLGLWHREHSYPVCPGTKRGKTWPGWNPVANADSSGSRAFRSVLSSAFILTQTMWPALQAPNPDQGAGIGRGVARVIRKALEVSRKLGFKPWGASFRHPSRLKTQFFLNFILSSFPAPKKVVAA